VAVDLVCAGILIVFAVIGAVRGLVRQVFGLVALAAVAVLAAPVGVRGGMLVAGAFGWGPGFTAKFKIATVLAAALVIWLVVRVVGRLVERAVGRNRTDERGLAPWNRYWGAAFGMLKAGLLCWLLLAFFDAFPGVAPGVTRAAAESWSIKTTQLFNPFARSMRAERRRQMEDALIALWKLKRHPAAWSRVVEEESVQNVLRHERILNLLDEGRGDLVGAVTDEEFRESLEGIDWQDVAAEAEAALEEAEKDRSKEEQDGEE
jgi:uncharacterized membrane protein required for colicin V production